MTKTDNILSYLPTHMKKDSSSNNYKFITSFDDDFQGVTNQIDNLKSSIQLSTATGTYLNSIGELFLLYRNIGESDDDYRARIKAYWPSYSGGGTIDGIKQAIERMTGLGPSLITITDYMPKTKLSADIDDSVDTINVLSTADFRDNNTTITIGDEIITYTGKTATSFTGCTRGALNSTAAPHTINSSVFDLYGDALKFKISAIIVGFETSIITSVQDIIQNSKAAGTYVIFNLSTDYTDYYGAFDDSVSIALSDLYWLADWRIPDSDSIIL